MSKSTCAAFAEIESPDGARRQSAALELERIGTQDALATLALARFRGEIDHRPTGKLVSDLDSPDAEIRRAAADFLGGFLWNDAEAKRIAVPALVRALRDSDRGVQISAAFALGVFGGSDSVSGLIEALRVVDDNGMKVVLIKALGTTRDKTLISLLVDLRDHGASRCIQVAAQKALDRIKGSTY